MFAASSLETQLSANFSQLSAFVQTLRQSSSAAVCSRNGRSSKAKKSRPEVTAAQEKPKPQIVEEKKNEETGLEEVIVVLQQQKLELPLLLTEDLFWKLVPVVLADTSQARNTSWRQASNVSASTFFENKTGFSEKFLHLNASQSFSLQLTTEMNRMLSPLPAVQVQQRRGMSFWSTNKETDGFGRKSSGGGFLKDLQEPSFYYDLKKRATNAGNPLDELLKNEKTATQAKINIAFSEGFRMSSPPEPESPFLKFGQKILVSVCATFLIIVIAIFLLMGTLRGPLQESLRFNVPHEIRPEEVNVTFADVKGCDEAKEELTEIVKFLNNRDKFKTMGAKLPKGLLMEGPPGVGKTLLAKATAGEAGVPFFQASGSEFDEIYVGSGAKKVRQLFQAAKARAPCIIFIDEIDSVGGMRTNSGLHPYANQTVNQLLSEMDGFAPTTGVIVVGATNKLENLDKALMRPGRFDMEVKLMPPDNKGRKDILELYLAHVKTSDDIDLDILSKVCLGMTGADLQNLINHAAIQAVMTEAEHVTMKLLMEARDRVTMGPAWKSRKIDDETNWNTAYHECGHALVAYYTKDARPLHKITILARGGSLGHTQFLMEKDSYNRTRAELLAQIDTGMGGRAGEEFKYGKEKVTTGASSDFKNVTAVAVQMVTELGMSDKVGKRCGIDGETVSPEWKNIIDTEVNKILQDSYARALHILKTHSDEFEKLASALIEYETLDIEEIRAVINGKPIRCDSKKKKTKPSDQKGLASPGAPSLVLNTDP